MPGFIKTLGVSLLALILTGLIAGLIAGALFGETAGIIAGLVLGGLSALKQGLAQSIRNRHDQAADALTMRRGFYLVQDERYPTGAGRLLPLLETMPTHVGRFRFGPSSVRFMANDGREMELALTPDARLTAWEDCAVVQFGPAAGSWMLQILDTDAERWRHYLRKRGLRDEDATEASGG